MQILEVAVFFFVAVGGICFSYITTLNNCTSTGIYIYIYIYIYMQLKLVTETDIKFTPLYTVSEKRYKAPNILP
jgi:hypothetical protein